MMAMRAPILVSMGLHVVFAVLLAVAPLGARAVFAPPDEIMVHLIEPVPSPPVIEPVESLVQPESPSPVTQNPVRRDRPLARHPLRVIRSKTLAQVAQANPVMATHTSTQAAASSLSRSLETPIEAVPSFIEMPRSFNRTGSPVAMSGGEGLSLPTDMITSVGALLNIGIIAPLNRPVLAGQAGPRQVFKDASAERAAGIRLKARPGQNMRPDYPRTAREAGWEGTVTLRVEVLPDGRAGVVSVHQTSGYSILDDAALTAVQRWRFSPAMDGNFPLRSVVHLPVRFDLTTP